MKSKILGLLAVGLLAGPMAANALSIVFDDPNQTVLRPSSGSVDVDFSANYLCDQGDVLYSSFVPFLFSSSGSRLDDIVVNDPFSCGNTLRFTFRVSSLDDLGLYDLDFSGSPAEFLVTYRDATGADQEAAAAFSINVVGSVPEPGTLALLGLGLAGLGLSRRRKH